MTSIVFIRNGEVVNRFQPSRPGSLFSVNSTIRDALETVRKDCPYGTEIASETEGILMERSIELHQGVAPGEAPVPFCNLLWENLAGLMVDRLRTRYGPYFELRSVS